MIEIGGEFKSSVTWIKTLAKSHSARVKILDVRKSSEDIKDLVEIFSPAGGIEGLSSEPVKRMKLNKGNLSMVDDHHATAVVSARECAICSEMRNWDIFLTEAYSRESGDIAMKWLVPNEKTVAGFLDRLREDGVSFTLPEKRNLTKRGEITARQEFVVRTAFDLGFFEYPKRINLEGLSARLNASSATLG